MVGGWTLLACALLAMSAGERGAFGPHGGESAGRGEAPPEGVSNEIDRVEVIGRRGAARLAPESELHAQDIDALGAEDVGAVIARVLETLGEQSAPVVLVNGRRAPDPTIFYNFPPDALMRVEALPPHAAGLYGAEPRRRVLNIVLQPRFANRDLGSEIASPTSGGLLSLSGDVRTGAIVEDRARQMGVRFSRDTSLRSDERSGYASPDGAGAVITLRPATQTVSGNLMRTGTYGDWSTSLGVTGRWQATALLGRVSGEALPQQRRTANLALTAGANGDLAGWALRLGLNLQMAKLKRNGGLATASTTQALLASLDADRQLAELPAGPLVINLSGQAATARARQSLDGERLTRDFREESIGASLSIPLLGSTAKDAELSNLSVGEMSLQLSGALRRISDETATGGAVALSWLPIRGLHLKGTWTGSVETPSEAQRLAPLVVGAPILVYDFRAGSAVEVAPVLGGEPGLRPARLEQQAFGLSLGPYTRWSLSGAVQFERSETTDSIGQLPFPTPQVEAAFPERFRRDAAGRLISIDLRPLNLTDMHTEKLTSNLTLTLPTPHDGRQATRLRLSFNHIWLIRSDATLRQGFGELDRLAGDGGGLPHQEVNMTVDGRHGPWGGNAVMRWRDGYRVRVEAGRDGPDDLQVLGLATVDAKLTYQFASAPLIAVSRPGQRRSAGFELEMGVENLFDSRASARLGDGRPASGYGRDDQDPVGRKVRLALKARF